MLEVAAGRVPTDENLAAAVAGQDVCTWHGALDGSCFVAGTGFDQLELTLPGHRPLRTARVLLTATLPTHRRQGLVKRLMAEQLLDMREQGIALAVFTTSGPGIYGRLGYAPATAGLDISLDPWRSELPGAAGSTRLVDRGHARRVLPELFDAHRRCQPGQISRSEAFWTAWFSDRPLFRSKGASERFIALSEDAAGVASGYVSYRLLYGELRDEPVRELLIEELVALTDDARRDLWGFCTSFRQAATVSATNLALDDPLPWLLLDPRSVRVTRVRDFLWLRLLDVHSALAERRYATEDSLVVAVSDDQIPANSGTYRIDGSPGANTCSRVVAPPELALDAAALAAVYFGTTSVTTLARAGRVRGGDAALRRADAFFSCSPAAWTVTDW